jgi:hypothetical protein
MALVILYAVTVVVVTAAVVAVVLRGVRRG